MPLTALILSAMQILGKSERVAPNDQLAAAISDAVDADTEEPLTGSRAGDAMLMTIWSWHEARYKGCVSGDKGKSWGNFQLGGYPIAIACADADAARIWLRMAHTSARSCRALDADARLAELASGSCSRGRALSRRRMRAARAAEKAMKGE